MQDACLFTRSPGRMWLDIGSWRRVSFSSYRSLVGLFFRTDVPQDRQDLSLVGAPQQLPGLCGPVIWKSVFTLLGKKVAEISFKDQKHSIWKVLGLWSIYRDISCNISLSLGLISTVIWILHNGQGYESPRYFGRSSLQCSCNMKNINIFHENSCLYFLAVY